MLTPAYKRLLCNAIIQPYFDYECFSWFPILKKNLKLKLQKDQNKWIRFSLNLPPRSHIDSSHFRKINWPGYIHEMFQSSLCRYSTRSQTALDIPLRKKNTGHKSVSFLGPKIWSKIGPSIKNVRISSSFMHAIKKAFYFIYKANSTSSYYHILMIGIIIWFSNSNIISSCHHWYLFKSFAIF